MAVTPAPDQDSVIAIAAPVAGTVVSVGVTDGDLVTPGQKLVMVEAMTRNFAAIMRFGS